MVALTTASPVFAHSDQKQGGDHGNRFAVNIGGILKALHDDGRGAKDKDKDHDNNTISVGGTITAISGSTITIGGEKGAVYTVNAASAAISDSNGSTLPLSSLAIGHTIKVAGTLSGSVITASKITDKTVNAAAQVSGTVAGLSGATLTITGENGSVYSVNASGATINGSSDTAMLAKIQIGDRVEVKGTVTGTTVAATKITDKALKAREMLAEMNGVRAGTVTAVNGNVITIDRFGTGPTTVNTSASTFFAAGGSATTSAALKVGSNIVVFGPTTTGVNDSISASVVFVLTHSVGFLKNLFR